jgi:hypothetical protein
MSIDSDVIQSTYTFQSRFLFLFLFGYFCVNTLYICQSYIGLNTSTSARLALASETKKKEEEEEEEAYANSIRTHPKKNAPSQWQ